MNRPPTARRDPAAHPAAAEFARFDRFRHDDVRCARAGSTLTGRATSVFDVCHVGVVLRALLFVHGVLGDRRAVRRATGSFAAWVTVFAAGSSAGACRRCWSGCWRRARCKRPFGALPLAGQWAVAIGLGAASGAVGSRAGVVRGRRPARRAGLAGPALAGAGLAAAMFQWLQLRAQALVPADTTARLAELQSRIRPHFLFNTLNTALALVRHDPARAEAVLEDLAELFRVAITENAESVTLAEEVELAQRYLAIEQIRFGSRLQVSWELDPDAGAARVPPLLLQPLVENAVRHGVEPATRRAG